MATGSTAERDAQDRLRRLNEIGISLSVERDPKVLLERILLEARGFTNADAGTLFLVKDDKLSYEITQNDTLGSFMGGTHGEINLPPVPLQKEYVSGYVAVTGETLNIADVYTEQKYHFEGPKLYDRMTGYRTKSMLVVPMKDHEDQIIGVLQLLNATHPVDKGEDVFNEEDQFLIQSLASQAAVAINNNRFIEDTEKLFESFVQVMATAIDERSPYTGGHIRRVMQISMYVAEAINACQDGPLAGAIFNEDQLNEIRIAAWMHDIGKITTPEWVVDKANKLETIFDRIELIETRYAYIRKSLQLERMESRMAALEEGRPLAPDFEETYQCKLAELDEEMAFVKKANLPGEFMEPADVKRVEEVAAKTYDKEGVETPRISAEEAKNLSVSRGSLTWEEIQKMRDHAAMSIKMLEQIPFTRKLSQVPAIAGAHHERLDGKGYPQGLEDRQISLQARILALADIFEALSASDRPYKKAKPQEVVLDIMQKMVDDRHIDRDIFNLFLKEKLYLKLEEIKLEELAAEDPKG
jgi:HD-GYP domain-containing protein (c-di-GMP phosphodiesterase class II)